MSRARRRLLATLSARQERDILQVLAESGLPRDTQQSLLREIRQAVRRAVTEAAQIRLQLAYPPATLARAQRRLNTLARRAASMGESLQRAERVFARQTLPFFRDSRSLRELASPQLPASFAIGPHLRNARRALAELALEVSAAEEHLATFARTTRGSPRRVDVALVLCLVARTLIANGLRVTTTHVQTKDRRSTLFARIAQILHPDKPKDRVAHTVLATAMRDARDPTFLP